MKKEFIKKSFKYEALMFALLLSLIVSSVNIYYAFKYPLNYSNIIVSEASSNNINVHFVCAVIATESSFNKNAVSSAGAIGLMQIMPSTGEAMAESIGFIEFNANDLYEPFINIAIGVRYLKYLFNKFGNVVTVLACYNAGETVVSEWLNDPKYSSDGVIIKTTPYKETNVYIDRVLNAYKIYRNKKKEIYL